MVNDLFNKTGINLSFEVSPPKTEADFQAIFSKLDAMAALHPDFISCTYGAGGSKAGKTREIASYIQHQLHIDAIAHMTCVGFKKEDLQANCDALEKEGIRHVMALRGDRPQAMTDEQFSGREFFYAADMIRYLKANTKLEIAGILYIAKAKRGSLLTMSGGNETALRSNEKLENWYLQLHSLGFEYAHSSYIVNLKAVIKIMNDELTLSNGEILSISRACRGKFHESFSLYFHKGYHRGTVQ